MSTVGPERANRWSSPVVAKTTGGTLVFGLMAVEIGYLLPQGETHCRNRCILSLKVFAHQL